MMDEHVTLEEIRRFRAGELPVGENRRMGNHIGSCADCSRLAQAEPAARRTADALAQALGPLVDDDHPDTDSITAFVEGRLSAEQRSLFEEHLDECERCREDVEDLRMIATEQPVRAPVSLHRPRSRSRAAFVFAAAAAAAVVAILFFLSPRREPRVTPAIESTTPRTPVSAPRAMEWPPTVRAAVASGQVDPPPLFLDLQQPPDAFRGEETSRRPGARLIDPVDEVVESTRPTFHWESHSGARYVVIIAEHGRLATRSSELTQSEWRPARDLVRGHVYEWQLVVTGRGGTTTVPEPPEPPVRFAVLAERDAAGIAAVRKESPDDHLLVGVLAARAGLRREAEAELRLAAQSPSTAESARRLLLSLSRWPHRPVTRDRAKQGS